VSDIDELPATDLVRGCAAVGETKHPSELDNWGNWLDHILMDYSNREPQTVRAKLIKGFRQGSHWSQDLLALLADMLDPAGKTSWRLQLRRRRSGNPGRLSDLDRMILCREYESILEKLRAEKRASPIKTARGELAKKWGMTDEEIRAQIARGQGRKKRKSAKEAE
jgi:hypothetical protein